MTIQPILTEDGSHTLFVPELNEVYHSRFGAVTESRHIFLEAGLKNFLSYKKLSILEIGFGTGLNAFLSVIEGERKRMNIDYTAVEPFPLDESVYSSLNYPEVTGYHEKQPAFLQLHISGWNETVPITPYFNLLKLLTRIENCNLEPESFELIYFDAFGPDVQPELWTEEIFRKMYEVLKAGGQIITYSAKGSVRRAMKAAGFTIEKLEGPPGKREITRGNKNPE